MALGWKIVIQQVRQLAAAILAKFMAGQAGHPFLNCEYYILNQKNILYIASLLNANVTSDNGYYGWKASGSELSFDAAHSVYFTVSVEDATIVVKDSNQTVQTPVYSGMYSLVNGTYTYEVSKEGYSTVSGEFTLDKSSQRQNFSITLVEKENLWDGSSADTSWYKAGESTFVLNHANQLKGLAKLVYEGNDFAGKTVELSTSLYLNNQEWIPIGTAEHPFNGFFNGKGFTVDGIKINNSEENQGLFGTIGASGTVMNLGIGGDIFSASKSGAVAGVNNGTIANVYAMAKVTGSNVGSIVGREQWKRAELLWKSANGAYRQR